jgi:hypothetical protein
MDEAYRARARSAMTHDPSTSPGDDHRLAERLLALEESHTFLARSLEVLSGEIHDVGTALRDLVRRVERLDDRLDGMGGPGGDDAGGFDPE